MAMVAVAARRRVLAASRLLKIAVPPLLLLELLLGLPRSRGSPRCCCLSPLAPTKAAMAMVAVVAVVAVAARRVLAARRLLAGARLVLVVVVALGDVIYELEVQFGEALRIGSGVHFMKFITKFAKPEK